MLLGVSWQQAYGSVLAIGDSEEEEEEEKKKKKKK